MPEKITKRAVDALKAKDQAKLDAAVAQVSGIEDQLSGLMQSMLPLLMGGSSTT